MYIWFIRKTQYPQCILDEVGNDSRTLYISCVQNAFVFLICLYIVHTVTIYRIQYLVWYNTCQLCQQLIPNFRACIFWKQAHIQCTYLPFTSTLLFWVLRWMISIYYLRQNFLIFLLKCRFYHQSKNGHGFFVKRT